MRFLNSFAIRIMERDQIVAGPASFLRHGHL
jgi:hypothetical protein